jgi:retron-type reverse transcriptase
MGDQPGNREESRMTCKPYDIPKTLIWEAWLHVKANQGAAGIDAETIERFEKKLGDNLYKLWNRMSSGSYVPPPVKAVPIPKKSGGVRILGIPTVADRIAQTAVKKWLEPRLDPIFRDDSYGYRPGKSALEAIAVTRRRCWDYDWIVEFDIRGLFDNHPHLLMSYCATVRLDVSPKKFPIGAVYRTMSSLERPTRRLQQAHHRYACVIPLRLTHVRIARLGQISQSRAALFRRASPR